MIEKIGLITLTRENKNYKNVKLHLLVYTINLYKWDGLDNEETDNKLKLRVVR